MGRTHGLYRGCCCASGHENLVSLASDCQRLFVSLTPRPDGAAWHHAVTKELEWVERERRSVCSSGALVLLGGRGRAKRWPGMRTWGLRFPQGL